MTWIGQQLQALADFMAQPRNLEYITVAIVATILVVFSEDIDKAVKKHIKHLNFVLRTVIFILVCSLGYGLFTVLLSIGLAKLLEHVSNIYLIPIVLFVFVILGILAERRKYI